MGLTIIELLLKFTGDLKDYPEEISDLFLKCFSQLSVQTPILASLLALIHAQDPEFGVLVGDKLHQRYLQAVSNDEVPVAKLLLRAISCLAACNAFQISGSGGLLEILHSLLSVLQSGAVFVRFDFLVCRHWNNDVPVLPNT